MKRLFALFLALLLSVPAFSTGVAPAMPKMQFLSANGDPLANGTLTVYLAGTETLTNTWQDASLSTLNTNPITLDSRGEATVWLNASTSYKFLLKNSAGSTQWTVDNIQGGITTVSGVAIPNSGTGAYNLVFGYNTTATANRTLTWNLNDANRSITLAGNVTTGGAVSTGGALTTAGAFTTAGAYSTTLTSTAATNVTLPTTGTLATLAGAETLTNKTISGGTITGAITASSPTLTGDVTVTGTVTAGTVTTSALTIGGQSYTTPGWVLLATATASSSASLTFTSQLTSTYDEYIFEFVDLIPATNAVSLYLRTSANGGTSYDSGGTDYAYGSIYQTAGSVSAVQSAGASQIILADTISNTASHGGVSGQLRLYRPAQTSNYKRAIFDSSTTDAGTTVFNYRGSGWRVATSVVSGVQFLMSSGNIASGTIRMYGVKKS